MNPSDTEPDSALPADPHFGPGGREAIYLLRTVHQNQMHLNSMADQKANILIGTMIIVSTIAFSRIYLMEDTDQAMFLTVVFFLVLEWTALILGAMALIPKTVGRSSCASLEQIPNKLFFGFFTQFPEDEYTHHMLDAIGSSAGARELLIRDIYQLGVVLKKKYRLLRYAYIACLVGLAAPVLYLVLRML